MDNLSTYAWEPFIENLLIHLIFLTRHIRQFFTRILLKFKSVFDMFYSNIFTYTTLLSPEPKSQIALQFPLDFVAFLFLLLQELSHITIEYDSV